jgi:hyperosmotically inducible periplasmic protein
MKLLQTRFMFLIAAFAIISATTVSCKGKKSDAEIQTEVTNKLNSQEGSTALTASVNDGVVTLSGECKDEECKRECAESVKNINGVKSVVNNIQIAMAAPAPVEITADEPLRASVNDAVKQYDGVEAEVKDGVVTLRGEIKRDNLQNLMMSLNALKPKKIENQLVVK